MDPPEAEIRKIPGPSDDQSILDATREVTSRLGIDFTPARVSWARIQSDECGFAHHRVLVSNRIKGRIPGEDFKPLLASSLIYLRKYRRARSTNLLQNFIMPLFLPMLAIILVALTVGRDPALWSMIGGPLEVLLAFILFHQPLRWHRPFQSGIRNY